MRHFSPAWRSGEQAAAVVFVRRYQRRVFGLAYSMTSDPTLAEEVAQESLDQGVAPRPGVRPPSGIGHLMGLDHYEKPDH